MEIQKQIEAAKQKLILAGRILQQHGHGDMTRGHLSVRVPGNAELFFLKAHSIGMEEITMDNILTAQGLVSHDRHDGGRNRHCDADRRVSG